MIMDQDSSKRKDASRHVFLELAGGSETMAKQKNSGKEYGLN